MAIKNKIKLCQRADEYMDELNAVMKTTERHIRRCESGLLEYGVDQPTIKAIKANLENSKVLKGYLHDEIVGMVDFQDDNKTDSFLPSSSGWRRFIPERLKGHGHWVDPQDQYEKLSYTGATERDFEFW